MASNRTRAPRTRIVQERNTQTLLPIAALLLLGLIGWYWHLYGSPFQFAMSSQSMANLGYEMLPASHRQVNDRFEMGGIQLGMTPDMVRRLHPSAKTGAGREGDKVLTVSTQRGLLVAWFTDDAKFVEIDGEVFANDRERVYRLRLDEAFANLTEQDLMRMYGRTYGRPLEATCERNQLGDTPRCTYRWWGGDGIELTAIMKQKVDANGQSYVLLTTIATNTQKSAQRASSSLRQMDAPRNGRAFVRG